MLLSQKLAGFSKGKADELRKVMGKKIREKLDKMKPEFIKGGVDNGHPEDKLNKIWTDWEDFASYAFNKSHSTCYAYVAYQTGYLKANYPAEFMAAVLSRNLSSIDKISIFMDECKRMGLKVLVPDVNESKLQFSVNIRGEVRFGMGAIKGVGEAASLNIIDERQKNGPYKDVWDFMCRVNLRSVNKKCMENLINAGAFDSFGIDRYRYFLEDGSSQFIESLIRFGQNMQAGNNADAAPSLFGDTIEVQVAKPEFPSGTAPSQLFTLNAEKDLIGIYLSSHPLDEYRIEIQHFCRTSCSDLVDFNALKGKEVTVAGMVTNSRVGTTKNGKPYTIFTLEDFNGSFEFALFGKDNDSFNTYAVVGNRLLIKGKVDFRFKGSDQLGFNIETIDFLQEIKKRIKSISLRVNVRDLDDEMIENIFSFTDETLATGVQLNFVVYDPAEKVWVELESKTLKMNVTQDLFEYLSELQIAEKEIDYRFN